eukprot:5271947-Amphidinium_carterae.1
MAAIVEMLCFQGFRSFVACNGFLLKVFRNHRMRELHSVFCIFASSILNVLSPHLQPTAPGLLSALDSAGDVVSRLTLPVPLRS